VLRADAIPARLSSTQAYVNLLMVSKDFVPDVFVDTSGFCEKLKHHDDAF
jgi:hypothetical protein